MVTQSPIPDPRKSPSDYAIAAVRLTRDEPGELVLLEGEGEGLTLPFPVVKAGASVAILAGVALVGWFLYSVLASPPPGPWEVTFLAIRTLFWLGIIGLILLSVWSSLWTPIRLRVDRAAGELLFVERNGATTREREERVPLSQLLGLAVEVTDRGAPNVTFRVERGSRKPRAVSVRLPVDAMDQRAEVVDLAFRMAAVAALPYQRVVRNDPRHLWLEVSRTSGEGWASVPAVEAPADYARNRVTAGASTVAAREVVPAFNPKTFRSDHRVTRWAPGQRVRLDKPLSLVRIVVGLPLLAATVLFLVVAPAALLRRGLHPTSSAPHPILALLILAVFGLAFGAAALGLFYWALPRRVDFDWPKATLTVGGWFRREEIPFAELALLDLTSKLAKSIRNRGITRYWYWCELSAHVKDSTSGTTRRMLLVTTRRSEDLNVPYDQALPLVTELSAALGVKRRLVGAPRSDGRFLDDPSGGAFGA
jgi:hypothetical protein